MRTAPSGRQRDILLLMQKGIPARLPSLNKVSYEGLERKGYIFRKGDRYLLTEAGRLYKPHVKRVGWDYLEFSKQLR